MIPALARRNSSKTAPWASAAAASTSAPSPAPSTTSKPPSTTLASVFVVVSPSKASVETASMPPALRAAYNDTVAPVVAALEKRATRDRHLVVQWASLRAAQDARNHDPQLRDPRTRRLFRAHDLHWNLEAGQLQAKAVVDAIAPGVFDAACAPVVDGVYVERDPELKNIYTKVGPTEPYASLRLAPGVTLQRETPALKQSLAFVTTSPCATAPLRLAVVRDSFLNLAADGPAPAQDGGFQGVASFVARSTFVHWDAFAGDPARARAALSGHDVVVIQVVQTNLANVIAHETKFIALAAALHDERTPSLR